MKLKGNLNINNINIVYTSGIYSLEEIKNIYKKYLYCALIEANKEGNKRVLPITYGEGNDGIAEKIQNFTGEVILLDSFDSYATPDILQALVNKQEDCMILVDTVNSGVLSSIEDVGVASIFHSEDVLIVDIV